MIIPKLKVGLGIIMTRPGYKAWATNVSWITEGLVLNLCFLVIFGIIYFISLVWYNLYRIKYMVKIYDFHV